MKQESKGERERTREIGEGWIECNKREMSQVSNNYYEYSFTRERQKEIRYGLKKQDKGEKDKGEGKREQKGRGNENSVRDKRQPVSGEERGLLDLS